MGTTRRCLGLKRGLVRTILVPLVGRAHRGHQERVFNVGGMNRGKGRRILLQTLYIIRMGRIGFATDGEEWCDVS